VLLSAKRTDFDVRPWIGGNRVFARPYKPRAGRRLSASAAVTAEAINPAAMLALLDRWLEPLRTLTGSDTLFQYWNPKSSHAGPVSVDASHSTELRINKALRKLAVVGARVTLNRVRASVLDLAHTVSKGDLLMVKAAAGHRSMQTAADHYVTAAGMAREDEALARAMSSQATMIGTHGRFDPRRNPDDPTDACTPGWQCDRPRDHAFGAPRSDGQCIAYGRCPVCRFGSVDFESPRACALTHLLLEAVERSIENMPAAAWLAQLAPIRMQVLEAVLPRFSREVHGRAALLELPELPSLE
jgi:hypothetical protein